MAEAWAARAEEEQPAEVQDAPKGPGSWWSDQPSGAKVCTLRLESVHLVHTGLAPGWEPEAVQAHLLEASAGMASGEAGATDGASPEAGPTEPCPTEPGQGEPDQTEPVPAQLGAWLEAIRFGHRELWRDAEEQGTTAALDAGGSLWVLSRGAHRVSVTCEAGGAEAREASGLADDARAWRLDRNARWRVEVTLPDGPGILWSARWRPAPALAPGAAVPGPAAQAPSSAGTREASFPARLFAWWKPTLPAPLRPYRKHLKAGGIALAAVVAGALLWSAVPKAPVVAAWTWLGDVCVGRYRAHVTTVPAGAALVVDGYETSLRTPALLLLREGRHRVEASLGRYGSASLSVSGRRGQRIAPRASLTGRLSVGCADPTVTLYARLDGQPIGRLPAVLDSVPAGRRHLSFQGRDVHPWTEEVGVVAGGTTRVLARPEKVPDFGVVLARAYRVGTEGLRELRGATVHLDGSAVGATPARLQVPRGLHTVRLSAGGVTSPVQLLRVEGGGELYATAEFGRSPEPEVVQELLGAPSVARPPVVRARLRNPAPIRIAEVRLHVRRSGREFERLPMALRAGPLDAEAEAALPVGGLAAGSQVSYFVTVRSDEGEEFVGEMRKVTLVP